MDISRERMRNYQIFCTRCDRTVPYPHECNYTGSLSFERLVHLREISEAASKGQVDGVAYVGLVGTALSDALHEIDVRGNIIAELQVAENDGETVMDTEGKFHPIDPQDPAPPDDWTLFEIGETIMVKAVEMRIVSVDVGGGRVILEPVTDSIEDRIRKSMESKA